ncbi:helix-turn-helix domain-containing protein [Kribbella sp. NPDC050124]|uniref:helix-turn-helix domain-containing protein n=1 Tax=Kribbella sp. NPDC050124 TaxID=3364114 RepID=UPI0037884995
MLRSEVFADRLPVAGERIELDVEVAPHGHAFFEIAVVVAGHAVHVSPAGDTELRRGSAVVLRPGEWHGYTDCDGLVLHNTYVAADVFARELAWVAEDPELGRAFRQSLRQKPSAVTQFEESVLSDVDQWCTALTRDQQPANRLGHLTLLAGALAPEHKAPYRTNVAHPAVQQAMRLLEASIDEGWTLSRLAADVHMAPGYLVRLFGRTIGTSPMAYLHRLRAERAAGLLIETDLPVAEIGARVGWHDPSHASRRFRACFGLSPQRYRATFRP